MNSIDNPEMQKYLENESRRKRFDEVSEEEKIERFVALQSLFVDKNSLINKSAKEEDINKANYFDFFKNVYKYTDEFKIDNCNKQQVADFFKQALSGNKLIKESLKFFFGVKKNAKWFRKYNTKLA